MTTRREPYAKSPARDSGRRDVRSHATSDIVLCLSTLVYLTLVLFDGVESPLFSLVLIGLATYALAQPRIHNRR